MDINTVNAHIKKLISISLQAEQSMEYVSELLRRVQQTFYLNRFWHSLVSLAQDAMKEYQLVKLDQAFFTRYVEKKKLPTNLMLTFRDFMNADVEIISIHRFRLEIDIYVEVMAVLSFRESLVETSKKLANLTYTECRASLMVSLSEIDRVVDSGTLPEGNVKDSVEEVFLEYKEAEHGDNKQDSIFTGIPSLDDYTGGFSRGDLIFCLAYAGSGKSTLILNIAYNAIMSGKNVIYFINELQFKQLRLKFISRHTANPKFWNGMLNGVPSKGINMGKLTKMQQKVLQAAISDFKDENYGSLYLVQLPANASLSYIESKMTAIQTTRNLDLCIIDDIRLCSGEVKGTTTTDVLSKVVVRAKSIAVNFNGGKGIPIISPWQTKQKSFEEALLKGEYAINASSDTNEIEKQADILLWLLITDEMKRKRQILCGMSKNRMGECPPKFPLMEAFEYSFVSELAGVTVDTSNGGVSTIPSGDYAALLRDSMEI